MLHTQDAHGGGIFQSIADGVKGVAYRFTAPVSGDEATDKSVIDKATGKAHETADTANAKAHNAADTVSAKVHTAQNVTIVVLDLPFCSRQRALYILASVLLQLSGLIAAALAWERQM